MSDFQRVVSDFFASLRLPQPPFDVKNSIVLAIDHMSIDLLETEDEEHILIQCSAGSLAENPLRRAEQVHNLLQLNLGYLPITSVCVSLLTQDDKSISVRIEALYPYRAARIDFLAELVQNVANLQEICARELGDAIHTQATLKDEPDLHGSVIFRP